MIKISNVQIKHNGLLSDDSTKLTLYLPHCTDNQHLEIIKMAKQKTIGVILVDMEQLNDISEVLAQVIDINIDSLPTPIDPMISGRNELVSAEWFDE